MVEQLILELDDAAFELGDPLGVGLGGERGACDRGQLGSDLAAELLAELSLERADDLLLAVQLRSPEWCRTARPVAPSEGATAAEPLRIARKAH